MNEDTIKLRLREAWDALRRVPARGVPGYKTCWPDVIHDFHDAYGWERAAPRLEPASPRAIDNMNEVFGWFAFIADRDLTRAVWLTVGCGMGPIRAGHILGVSRWTVARWRQAGLDAIATGLGKSARDSCNHTGSNATARVS
jgi:Domain of unknown function (DUF6362)